MDSTSTSGQHEEITKLQQQLQILRQSVTDMEALLDRYVMVEQALRRSEEHFRLLVTGVRDYAIFMLDTQGYIASWNTGAQLIKGYTAEEIIGKHFSIFYLPDEAASKPPWELEVAARDGVYKEEGWRVRKDGTLFWASVTITALFDQGILRGFGKVTRDLTERKKAEEAQQQLQEQELRLVREQAARVQAEAHMRLREEFLRATAHELKTPVTSVLGYAELLLRRFERGDLTPDRVHKPVHSIATQAQRLDRLTTMLLDSTRLEHGNLVLERTPIDLRPAIQQVAYELQLLTEQHTIVLDLPASPVFVEGDRLRFEQVVYNLVQNAIKYSPVGGTIRVAVRQDARQVTIAVTDTGMGIPAEDQPHVFDRFYRATNIAKGTISGLGLGLYLVKEFVTMQGGTVEVESVIDQGTTFRVILPCMD